MMGSRLAYMMAILFIGSLAMIAQLDRVEAGRSYYRDGHGHANNTSVANATATSLEESKLKLRFCVLRGCEDKRDVFFGSCTCCLTLPDVPCWGTDQECYDVCPVCDPECPTYPPPAEFHL